MTQPPRPCDAVEGEAGLASSSEEAGEFGGAKTPAAGRKPSVSKSSARVRDEGASLKVESRFEPWAWAAVELGPMPWPELEEGDGGGPGGESLDMESRSESGVSTTVELGPVPSLELGAGDGGGPGGNSEVKDGSSLSFRFGMGEPPRVGALLA